MQLEYIHCRSGIAVEDFQLGFSIRRFTALCRCALCGPEVREGFSHAEVCSSCTGRIGAYERGDLEIHKCRAQLHRLLACSGPTHSLRWPLYFPGGLAVCPLFRLQLPVKAFVTHRAMPYRTGVLLRFLTRIPRTTGVASANRCVPGKLSTRSFENQRLRWWQPPGFEAIRIAKNANTPCAETRTITVPPPTSGGSPNDPFWKSRGLSRQVPTKSSILCTCMCFVGRTFALRGAPLGKHLTNVLPTAVCSGMRNSTLPRAGGLHLPAAVEIQRCNGLAVFLPHLFADHHFILRTATAR